MPPFPLYTGTIHAAFKSYGTTRDSIHLLNILRNRSITLINPFFNIYTTIPSIPAALPPFLFFSSPIISSFIIPLATLPHFLQSSPLLHYYLSPYFVTIQQQYKIFFPSTLIVFSRVNSSPIEFLIGNGPRLPFKFFLILFKFLAILKVHFSFTFFFVSPNLPHSLSSSILINILSSNYSPNFLTPPFTPFYPLPFPNFSCPTHFLYHL